MSDIVPHEPAIARQLADRPLLLLWTCFGLLVAAGWAMVLAHSQWGVASGFDIDVLTALCRADGAAWSGAAYGAVLVMWAAMTLAMMLPTAAPMVSVYLDISGAARDKAMDVPSAWVLIAGYGTVWLGFALIAAAAQIALQRLGALDPDLAVHSPWLAAAVLLVAGLWQFSAVKHACLTKCQRPLPYFLGHWRESRSGVFAIGFGQGLYCLGCCWALMAVMFVAGIMNVLWMVLLGAAMMVEKAHADSGWFTRGLGVMLIAAAAALGVVELTG